MENHEKHTNSDEQTPDFEFGSLTPSSPSQDSFTENSPADHFFSNGRLLPHVFSAASNNTIKRSTSLTISEYISRSNSTNSRSSICSNSTSPRTSICTGNNNNNNSPNNHKLLDLKPPISRCGKNVNPMNKSSYSLPQCKRKKATEMVRVCLYRSYSSQRWQYITPAPVKKNGGIRVGGRKKAAARMRKKVEERRGNRVVKWWRRILMAAIFACRECHALESP